ncbi:MAG: DUF5060 domain-containing protein [Candidatus Brocadiia bacterium]
MRRWMLAALVAMAAGAALGATAPGRVLKQWSFEYDTAGWASEDCVLSWSKEKACEGGWSLRMEVDFPRPATAYVRVPFDVDLVGRMVYHVYVPEGAPESVKTLLFLKDKDGLWFQHFVEEPLTVGGWNTVSVDVSASSPALRPSGHHAQWDSVVARRMSLVGVKFFCDESFSGALHLDAVGAERAAPDTDPLRVIGLRQNAMEVARYEKFELTFDINRAVANPFDPEEVAIEATFVDPKGEATIVPAFYYQDFTRDIVNDREELTPIGPGRWKVRFSPTRVYPQVDHAPPEAADDYQYYNLYHYYLTVRCAADPRTGREAQELVTDKLAFACALPRGQSEAPGFVRVCEKDPRYFAFDNGQWFYPIGHNVHSPNDETPRAVRIQEQAGSQPLPDHGTFSYDYLFARMAENGENFAEVWMCAWWLGLEWNSRWRNYRGLTDYNLHSAWRLDYLVELARKHDLYLHLVLDNHGKASTWTDPEWEDNPYNELNGGFLPSPEEFFRHPEARKIYKKKLRYIIARWGYSPRIAGLELWSEIDLVGDAWAFHANDVRAAPKVQWHREMTEYLDRTDPWDHLVTTHFSTNYGRIKSTLVTIPGIDYIACDAYYFGSKSEIIGLLLKTVRAFNNYNKPGLVTEYGGSPFGTTMPALRADIHAGLWTTYMTHTAGSPLIWWHQFIECDDAYYHYKALAAFHEGEDRPGQGLERQAASFASEHGDLAAMALQNETKAYVWVYSQAAMTKLPERGEGPVYKDVVLRLTGLEKGSYRIEVWDTHEGSRMAQLTRQTEGSRLDIPLPAFRNDCALKVKPAG